MRIALAEFKQETNTFSPLHSDRSAFEREGYLLTGDRIVDQLRDTNTEVSGFLDVLAGESAEAVPILAAFGLSGGPLDEGVFRELAGQLVDAVEQAGPIDGLLLALHGALATPSTPDAEGCILSMLRERLGRELPIVCSLDMHANLTREMVSQSTALAAYRTNPHTDFRDCGRRAASLLFRLLGGAGRACWAVKLPMISPPENAATTQEPMASIMREVLEAERIPGVLSVGLFQAQPWLDVPELGDAVYVCTDGTSDGLARQVCEELAAQLWERRFALRPRLWPVQEALAVASECQGLCVFSDSADSITSGSPGDSTYLLQALLHAELERPAYLLVVDPEVVAETRRRGEGASIDADVGGKCGSPFHQPVRVRGEIERVLDARFMLGGQSLAGFEVRMGWTCVIRAGQIRLVVTSNRVIMIDPELFRCVGLEPAEAGIVCVKSPNMYKANYAALAEKMLVVDAPGVSPADFTRLPYRHVPKSFFPWQADLPYRHEVLCHTEPEWSTP